MSQNPGGQGNSQGGTQHAQGRPAVLDQVSSTTLDDLEQQFAENDRAEWNRFTESFGWSREDSDAVWNWFGQRPAEGQDAPSAGGFPEGPGLGGK